MLAGGRPPAGFSNDRKYGPSAISHGTGRAARIARSATDRIQTKAVSWTMTGPEPFAVSMPHMSDGLRVRDFHADYAPALAEIFHRAVHEIARQHYTEEQMHAWSPSVPSPARFIDWGLDGRTFLVALDQTNKPVAFGDLEADGHIDHLFCDPDFAGTGVTARLYHALEERAREQHIALLYVEASEPARRFFLRQGFTTIERRDFEIAGVPIHNYRMEKRLI